MQRYFIVTLIGVVLVESVLSLIWSKVYFRTGIPIFRRTCEVSKPGAVPTAELLQERIPQGPYPSLLFRDLGTNALSFREKNSDPGKTLYSPVMRGALRFDTGRGKVMVTGYANWSAIVFALVVLANIVSWIPTNPDALSFLVLCIIILVGLFGFIYLIQRQRFIAVVDTASALWEMP